MSFLLLKSFIKLSEIICPRIILKKYLKKMVRINNTLKIINIPDKWIWDIKFL